MYSGVYKYTYMHIYTYIDICTHMQSKTCAGTSNSAAAKQSTKRTISRLPKNIGLFCKRAL